MSLFDLLLLPLLLGLLGFFEPCSLGVNSIFLAYIRKLDVAKRIGEAIVFSFARAFVLSLVGLLVVIVGRRFFVFQSSYFIVLGLFYILLGVFSIISKHRGIPMPGSGLLGSMRKKNLFLMAIVFGAVIPACAIPLLLALLSKTLLTGDILAGWVSLAIFGLGLSLPLVIISASSRADRLMQKIHTKVSKWPYLTGIVLIIIGIITALSSVWWNGVL